MLELGEDHSDNYEKKLNQLVHNITYWSADQGKDYIYTGQISNKYQVPTGIGRGAMDYKIMEGQFQDD